MVIGTLRAGCTSARLTKWLTIWLSLHNALLADIGVEMPVT